MDFVIKILSQAPLVAAIMYMWYLRHKEDQSEMKRLRERIKEKDEQLGEFARVFDKLSVALELIKDRLR